MKRRHWLTGCAAVSTILLAGYAQATPTFSHVVVIYQENHSFDNLYGNWGQVGQDTVNGRQNATQQQWSQVRQDNVTPYQCLLQDDVNLTSPPLPTTCTDSTGSQSFNSNFTNQPFNINTFIKPNETTCPPPGAYYPNGVPEGQGLPGGCTRDIVHRYYEEQYQLDGGKQDRYTTGSDASGLTMGYYDSTLLPIYKYLHQSGAPNYVIADNFFQGAFGGSFLNHQILVSATAPIFKNAVNDGGSTDLHSVVDTNGMPSAEPLYSPTGAVKDQQLLVSCNPPGGGTPTVTCGDNAVNTIQPTYQPYSPGTPSYKQLPPLTNPTIGDRLSDHKISWAWYSGGWSNAAGNVGAPGWTNGKTAAAGCTDPDVIPTATWPYCPDKDFQFHHQAFNFFANYAPDTKARKQHLRDEKEFLQQAKSGALPAVSFIKPLGEDNEHPGYASEKGGSSHLVELIKAALSGPEGADTLVVVTYDEFGGQWDHVSPPGQGNANGPADQWGPGTRVPALLVSSKFTNSGVDHIEHDTTSIMATLEHWYTLAPVATRDAKVSDLQSAISKGFGQ